MVELNYEIIFFLKIRKVAPCCLIYTFCALVLQHRQVSDMINYFYADLDNVEKINSICENCWINLVDPTPEEIAYISIQTGIEESVLTETLDEEETSRIDSEKNYTVIIIDTPTSEEKHGKQTYITIPMAIFLTKKYTLTLCTEDTPLLGRFENGKIKNFSTKMKSRFTLQILYRNATLFLQYLRSINKKSEIVEKRLNHSTQNKELIQLLELEKSLVYFSTSLKGNELVLDKLLRSQSIKKYPDDEELLEDTIIENKQAIEMSGIYSGILSETREAFSSVIANNLNRVMKTLAVITIVMSIPTMVFSAYGMNFPSGEIPLSNNPYGFWLVIGGSALLVLIVILIFTKIKMFK